MIVVCAVRSEIDRRVCRAQCDCNSYVSVRKYKQRKIATELHRPKWVSPPLVDAILRDDVLMIFITPPEFQTEPLLDAILRDDVLMLFITPPELSPDP